MITVTNEIESLEEKLKQAELGPDPEFFDKHLDDEMVLVLDGKACQPKKFIVEAHQPGNGQTFRRVEMSDMKIVDHGNTAVVTCTGTYEGSNGSFVLKFLRVWARKEDGWKIIAGTNI